MPCFYFHLRYGPRLSRDDEGTVFPDLCAATDEALLTARDMLVEAIKHHHKAIPDAVEIADEAGRTLHTLPLATILPEPFRR